MHPDVGEQIHQLPQHGFIQRRAGVVFRQHAFQARIAGVGLDGLHGVIDDLADIVRPGVSPDVGPAGGLRHPEHVFGQIFVRLFRVGIFLRRQPVTQALKRFGDVFQEDQAQRHMLVFGGLKPATHLVGGLEKISSEIEVRLSAVVGHECFAL